MDKLLIIADDFTGALDTGIQFTKMGNRVRVLTDWQYDFSSLSPSDSLLSVNADTRPLSPKAAYERVFTLAKNARKAGFSFLYKKTDSALRGNIGSELEAAMDAYNQKSIAFIPALPSLNRITKNGVHYIDGIPVEESVFGKDPFEPVKYSAVADIIRSQSNVCVENVTREHFSLAGLEAAEKTIFIFDAETDGDLAEAARILQAKGRLQVTAGCAGFAEIYGKMLSLGKGNPVRERKTDGLFVLCGSVNPITKNQLDFAEKNGFTRLHLSGEQKLHGGFSPNEDEKSRFDSLFSLAKNSKKIILDTFSAPENENADSIAQKIGLSASEVRFRIADSLGATAMQMVERGLDFTFCLTGGDTLSGFMRIIGAKELTPIAEIGKGAVLSALEWQGKQIQIISKSGGFGSENIFLQMYNAVTTA